MSWLDKVKNKLVIKCGDGNTYTPSWINATKQKEYNIAEFEFPETDGTLVFRSRPKGARYNLELYFQGDDCIDLADAFEKSSDDARAWTLSHPFFGLIIVQPLGIDRDNTKYNVSKITTTVVETIITSLPTGTIDPADFIAHNKEILDQTVSSDYAANFSPTPSDIDQITTNMAQVKKAGLPSLKLDIDAQKYFNAFNNANTAIQNLANDVQQNMLIIQDFLNFPALITQSVKIRVQTLVNQFTTLQASINNLQNAASSLFDTNTKRTYEAQGNTVISTMAIAATTQMDYSNRNDVISIIEAILTVYNSFLTDLDSFQDVNASSPDSYVPSFNSMIGLNDLINFTVSSLFIIGLQSKQERVLYLEADTNVIKLAHRLYGLLPDDSTIDTLIANNNIGLNEILQLKKGRRIIYYQ